MRMAGDEDRDLRKFGSQRHHRVGKIIAAGTRFQSHVAGQHNGIRAFALCFCDRAAHRLNRLLKIDACRKLPRQPERHSRRGDPDDRKFYPGDFPRNERLNLCKRMSCVGKFASGLCLQHHVRGQNRHCRSLQSLVKRLDPPIEFVITHDPGVVLEVIELIDHQLALVSQTNVGALIHVAHIDQ